MGLILEFFKSLSNKSRPARRVKEGKINCPACGKNGLKTTTMRIDPFDHSYSSYSCFEKPAVADDPPTEVSTNVCDDCGFKVTDEELGNSRLLTREVKNHREKSQS